MTAPNKSYRQVGGNHYAKGGDFQHWDLIEYNGIGYLEGYATKYLTRWREKNGVEDLKKALHCVEKLDSLRRVAGRESRGRAPQDQLDRFFKRYPGIDEPTRKVISLLCGRWDQLDLAEAQGILVMLINQTMLINQNTADNGKQ